MALEITYGDNRVRPLSAATINGAVKNLRKYHYTREPYNRIDIRGASRKPLGHVLVNEYHLVVVMYHFEEHTTILYTGAEAVRQIRHGISTEDYFQAVANNQ